jgi:hypothetical protein
MKNSYDFPTPSISATVFRLTLLSGVIMGSMYVFIMLFATITKAL